MGKRIRIASDRLPRAMLGTDHNKNLTVNKVTELFQTVAEATIKVPFDFEQMMAWLAPSDTLRIMREAKGVIHVANTYSYVELFEQISLMLDFEKTRYAVPAPNLLRIQGQQGKPLADLARQVRTLYLQWMEVRHLVTWFDRNATAGAARYYWPTILSLAPASCEVLHEASSVRLIDPPKISSLLPMIRRTSSLVAGALMISKASRPLETVQFKLGGNSYTTDEGVDIDTPVLNVGCM